MRRFLIVSSVVVGSTAFGQSPQVPPTPPRSLPPTLVVPTPGALPPGVLDLTKQADETGGDATVVTPAKERFVSIDVVLVNARYAGEAWQLFAGPHLLADFGKKQADAEEAKRVVRELRPTEWATIGTGRPVVGYGLSNGKPRLHSPQPKVTAAIDLKTTRAEQVRGVWVLKDDAALHLNFGTHKADAEQAAAVVRKYGFNQVGQIGYPTPTFSYFYAAPAGADKAARPGPSGAAGLLAQANSEQVMGRTGIPIPGVGFAGEMVKFDPRKVEVRRDKGVYSLVSGPDELARFGGSEWSARDALKLIQDCRFTEHCQLGEMSFFLVNGQAPTRVPFNAQGRSFNPKTVKVRVAEGGFGVFEDSGRQLFRAATVEEAEQMARAIQGFGFDMVCQLGLSPATSLRFLAKTGAR